MNQVPTERGKSSHRASPRVAPPGGSPASPQVACRNGKPPLGLKSPVASLEAKRIAALVLEVLAGTRTPAEAAASLEVSLPRYYQLEGRAFQGLVAACEPLPHGRHSTPERMHRNKEHDPQDRRNPWRIPKAWSS